MKDRLKSVKWMLLVSGLLIVALGVIMFFTPWANLVALAIFIGIMMLIAGVSEIAAFFHAEKGHRSGMILVGGILSAWFGIWTVFGRGDVALAVVLPTIFAAWVMLSGFTRGAGAMALKSKGSSVWIWMLLLGIVEAALGFVLLFHPLLAAIVASYTLAFMLITYGMNDIVLFFEINKKRTEALDL